MEQRTLGRTGRPVSVVGLGTWQLGADWGEVSEDDARAVLEAAVEEGVTFFDTADVYGDGRSETVIGRFLADRPDAGVTVATKMGRRAEQVPESYVLDHFRAWTDRSRRNLGVDTLDLVQLHCPPTSVYSDDAVYDALDTLVAEGAVAAYGVSVEKVEEALAAIARPHVATVQIIANAFRLKPLEEVFPAAAEAGVGIIVRVPLASGLLSREVRRGHDVRRGRPPLLQPRRQRVRRRGDVLRGGLRRPGWSRRGSSASWSRAEAPEGTTSAQAALAWLCQQPAVSTRHPGRPHRRAGPRATRRPGGSVRSARRSTRASGGSTTRTCGPRPPPLVGPRGCRAPDFGPEPGRTRALCRHNPGACGLPPPFERSNSRAPDLVSTFTSTSSRRACSTSAGVPAHQSPATTRPISTPQIDSTTHHRTADRWPSVVPGPRARTRMRERNR